MYYLLREKHVLGVLLLKKSIAMLNPIRSDPSHHRLIGHNVSLLCTTAEFKGPLKYPIAAKCILFTF